MSIFSNSRISAPNLTDLDVWKNFAEYQVVNCEDTVSKKASGWLNFMIKGHQDSATVHNVLKKLSIAFN
jgi:hypothetical protein